MLDTNTAWRAAFIAGVRGARHVTTNLREAPVPVMFAVNEHNVTPIMLVNFYPDADSVAAVRASFDAAGGKAIVVVMPGARLDEDGVDDGIFVLGIDPTSQQWTVYAATLDANGRHTTTDFHCDWSDVYWIEAVVGVAGDEPIADSYKMVKVDPNA